jgi:hypothetical protein
MALELAFFFKILFISIVFVGCAGQMSSQSTKKNISNPFVTFDKTKVKESQSMVTLRTTKGDRTVEVELPGGIQDLSDFVLPLSPHFSNNPSRSIASVSDGFLDESYKEHLSGLTDKEIEASVKKTTPLDMKRKEIESHLNLITKDAPNPQKSSYLAMLDRIKQLYRINRFEAALIEVDNMLKLYPFDAKIHEMRGTLLDRIGRSELAVKAWNQSLQFDPNNKKLKTFIQSRQSQKMERFQ